jgi:hypothetical protein
VNKTGRANDPNGNTCVGTLALRKGLLLQHRLQRPFQLPIGRSADQEPVWGAIHASCDLRICAPKRARPIYASRHACPS